MIRRTLAVVFFVLAAAPAHAQESKAAKKVDDMNRAAMEDYDLLEFDAARKQLGEALALAKRSKLEKSGAAARSHLDLAIVYGAGLNDHDNALLEFIAALQIDPNLKLDPAYKSPALQKTFDQARATVTGGPPPGPAASEERGLKHTPVEEAQGGQAIAISARVGADLRPTQVVLVFRPAGAEGFLQVAMKSSNGVDYQGTIPEGATRGPTVHYYIEARGPSGKVLAAAGNGDTPNIISIIQPVGTAGDGHDEENPLGRETSVAKTPEGGKRSFWIGVSVGSGAGYVTGETEVSHQEVTCCLAPAPFHVLPEVGYWLSPHIALSLAVRLGFPIGANVAGAATLAPAVIGRFDYMTGTYGGIVIHGDLGGGFIRHVIKLTATSATAVMGDTDTFATGPLFVGGGVGWNKPIGNMFHFVIDLDVLAGLPIISEVGGGTRPTKLGFAVNADLSLGMQVAF